MFINILTTNKNFVKMTIFYFIVYFKVSLYKKWRTRFRLMDWTNVEKSKGTLIWEAMAFARTRIIENGQVVSFLYDKIDTKIMTFWKKCIQSAEIVYAVCINKAPWLRLQFQKKCDQNKRKKILQIGIKLSIKVFLESLMTNMMFDFKNSKYRIQYDGRIFF